jgi:hypothetical protein
VDTNVGEQGTSYFGVLRTSEFGLDRVHRPTEEARASGVQFSRRWLGRPRRLAWPCLPPHSHAIHTTSSSTPTSRSPQARCSVKKAPRLTAGSDRDDWPSRGRRFSAAARGSASRPSWPLRASLGPARTLSFEVFRAACDARWLLPRQRRRASSSSSTRRAIWRRSRTRTTRCPHRRRRPGRHSECAPSRRRRGRSAGSRAARVTDGYHSTPCPGFTDAPAVYF